MINHHLRERNMPYCDHVYAEVAIDNTTAVSNPGSSGLTQLREKIMEVAKKQSYWGERRPIRWLLLADKLDEEREKRPQIPLAEVKNLATECGLKSDEEVFTFLTFHHNLGDLIYLNDSGLRDTVILSPQWLGDVFRYGLIEHGSC